MNAIFTRIRGLAIIIAGILTLSSCLKADINRQNPEVVDGMAEISFTARMPSTSVVETRSGETGTTAENSIDDIYILVFETTGELVYKGKARNLVPSGIADNLIAFTATLPVEETYDFMVLANTEALLSEISVGSTPAKTKTEVEALVQQYTAANSENGKWKSSAAIPMWDEQTSMELTVSSTPMFYLTRMLARINVEYKPATGVYDPFRLTSIRYYNYNTSGKVVPAVSGNMTGTAGDRHATIPTLPDDPGTQIGEYLEYTGITGYKTCKNLIYVFEAEQKGEYDEGNSNWIDNPCLVVGGMYDSDHDGDFEDESETWYRIDFIKKTTVDNVITEDWLSLLRNFSYNVEIYSVSGEGYNDPNVALESVPMNINAGIIDWNDGQMNDIIIDGPRFLSVGYSRNDGLQKAALLYRNESSTDEMPFSTNIPLDEFEMTFVPDGYTTWPEEPTTAEQDAGVVAKIFHPLCKVEIVEETVENGVTYGKFVFTALKNYEQPLVSAVLTVTSGRIRYTINISQHNSQPEDWNDGGNKEEIL